MRTTLTNQPNLLSRRKELEEAYLPTRSHLINSRHLDFRHFTRPSSPLASPQSSSATSQSTPFSQSMTTIGAGNSFCYIQLKNVFKNLLKAVLGSHHIFLDSPGPQGPWRRILLRRARSRYLDRHARFGEKRCVAIQERKLQWT